MKPVQALFRRGGMADTVAMQDGLKEAPRYQMPAVIARNERIVQKKFWTVLLHRAGKIPFAEELGAAYYCVMDPKTPPGVKALLLAALAYFVLPFDFLPAFFIALGLASDAAIVLGTVRMVSRHIKPEHYKRSRAALGILEPVAP